MNISRQSVYLYERRFCNTSLVEMEAALWDKIERLGIEASGYYHYDEEFIKISGDVYVRLSLIDVHTRIIINDLLIPNDEFDKECIKKFFIQSLTGLKIDTIITDGNTAYKEIIEELGAKHQLCVFHIMQNLMTQLNKRANILKNKIKTLEN